MNQFEPTPEHPGKTWTGFFHLLSKKESRMFATGLPCPQTSNKVVPRKAKHALSSLIKETIGLFLLS